MQTSAVGVVAVRSLRFERKMGGSVVGAFAWLARRKQRFKSGRRETSASGVCAELLFSHDNISHHWRYWDMRPWYSPSPHPHPLVPRPRLHLLSHSCRALRSTPS
ncbi:hypothetical protein IG631_12043 [Alternaria alternata]|nr:hypothetical protein IG631_12043 [Alternaria alternata]